MATVKVCANKGGGIKGLDDYLKQEQKTEKELVSGKDCNPERMSEEFQATKELYNKTTGRQYYHLVQAFKPGEVTASQAHEIGKELANIEKFKNYEVVIITHIDKKHIHNHLVINSVSFEDGKKFHQTIAELKNIKELSNEICRERGLTEIDLTRKSDKYVTMAEYQMNLKGKDTWKEDLREAIDFAKSKTNSIDDMKKYLQENFNIEMKIQDKNLKFKHPDQENFCRGSRLGGNYEKEVLEHEFNQRQNKRIEERRDGHIGNTEQDRTTGEQKLGNESADYESQRKDDRGTEQNQCTTIDSNGDLFQQQAELGEGQRNIREGLEGATSTTQINSIQQHDSNGKSGIEQSIFERENSRGNRGESNKNIEGTQGRNNTNGRELERRDGGIQHETDKHINHNSSQGSSTDGLGNDELRKNSKHSNDRDERRVEQNEPNVIKQADNILNNIYNNNIHGINVNQSSSVTKPDSRQREEDSTTGRGNTELTGENRRDVNEKFKKEIEQLNKKTFDIADKSVIEKRLAEEARARAEKQRAERLKAEQAEKEKQREIAMEYYKVNKKFSNLLDYKFTDYKKLNEMHSELKELSKKSKLNELTEKDMLKVRELDKTIDNIEQEKLKELGKLKETLNPKELEENKQIEIEKQEQKIEQKIEKNYERGGRSR